MKSVTKIKTFAFLLIAFVLLCCCTSSATAAVKNGYLSKKLDEYYSTIKCLANILDDLMIPDFNLFVCCGVWIVHDWLGGLVLDNCYDHNYYQLNNLTEPFLQQMEENCSDYPKESFSCKLVLITPIAVVVTIFLLIITLSACTIYMCIRLRHYQRYFEYQKSQEFDSTGDETTDEASTATMKKGKSIDI